MRDLVEDASGKKLYVCLRCGHQFWSRAKKPQCGLCKSKRVIPYEEFLKLPEEERNKILGKRSEEKEEKPAEEVREVTAKVEEHEDEVKKDGEEGVKPGKDREVEVKREESSKTLGVKKGEKPGEKVKDERVKKKAGFKVPVPKLSWKVWGLILGLAFLYYLYKIGWFDAMLDHLKFLKTSSEAVEAYEKEPRRRDSPVLERISKNLGG